MVAETGHLETARYLVDFCRSTNKPNKSKQLKPKLDINAVNCDKKTALQIAAEKGLCFLSIIMSLLLFSAEFTVNPEVRVVMSLFLLKFIYLSFSVSSGYSKDIFLLT